MTLGPALALVLAAAACGGGEEQAATAAAGSAAAGASTSGGTTVQVAMKDNSFDPKNITVSADQEITFELINRGVAPHNMAVKVDNKNLVSQPDPTRAGAKGKLVVSFAKAGTYNFKCDYHPVEMTGTITVK